MADSRERLEATITPTVDYPISKVPCTGGGPAEHQYARVLNRSTTSEPSRPSMTSLLPAQAVRPIDGPLGLCVLGHEISGMITDHVSSHASSSASAGGRYRE